jgi:hypothetical protein
MALLYLHLLFLLVFLFNDGVIVGRADMEHPAKKYDG